MLCLTRPALAEIPARPAEAFLADYPKALTQPAFDSLAHSLETFHQHSHRTLMVVVIKRMAPLRLGSSIQALAMMWFDQWHLEPSDALVLISLDDHQARIQLGSAWGTSLDGPCREIMEGMTERFKAQDLAGGLTWGCSELGQTLASSTPPPPVASSSQADVPPRELPGVGLMKDLLAWLFCYSLFPWPVATVIALLALSWVTFAIFFTSTWREESRKLGVGLGLLAAAGATFVFMFWIALAVFVGAFFMYCAANSTSGSGDDSSDDDSSGSFSSDSSWSDSSGGGGYSSASGSSSSDSSSSDSGGATGTW